MAFKKEAAAIIGVWQRKFCAAQQFEDPGGRVFPERSLGLI
jgi:hypothetical protein